MLTLTCRQAQADNLSDIRHRGHLRCAVNIDTDDFSDFDGHGDVSTFETSYCRAIAAAILGDAGRAAILSEGDEISGLHDVRDGRADLMGGAPPPPQGGHARAIAVAGPILLDGQGFLVDPKLGIGNLAELKDARVCFIGNTPAQDTLHDRLGELGVKFTPFEFSERGEMEAALATNHCNLVTGDITELANMRLSLPALAGFDILAETITVDPLAPAVHDGEPHLLAVVTAVDDGLLETEEHGVTRANAAGLVRTATDPIVRRLVGRDGWIGPALGLDNGFLARAVEAEGNHAEIYRRDAGDRSRLHLPVGANRPVSAGGALITLPVEIAR